MVYDDQTSTFEELLNKDGNITIQQQNIRSLAVEMFKVINHLPPFMRNILTKNSNLVSTNVSANTRSNSTLYNYNYNNPSTRTRNYGLETLRCLGPKLYDMIPNERKQFTTATPCGISCLTDNSTCSRISSAIASFSCWSVTVPSG